MMILASVASIFFFCRGSRPTLLVTVEADKTKKKMVLKEILDPAVNSLYYLIK